MADAIERSVTMPLGIVVRREKAKSRWVKWLWKPIAVLPGAGPADWVVLTEDEDATDYHAATLTLELHRKETEGYKIALAIEPPSVYVILRPSEDDEAEHDVEVFKVTASPHEAQDYLDSGEEIVEAVPMTPGLVAWVREFTDRHHVDEEFKKRRRDRQDIGQREDGKGDPRVRQAADVFRAPGSIKKGLH